MTEPIRIHHVKTHTHKTTTCGRKIEEKGGLVKTTMPAQVTCIDCTTKLKKTGALKKRPEIENDADGDTEDESESGRPPRGFDKNGNVDVSTMPRVDK